MPLGDRLLCTASQVRHAVHLLDSGGATAYTDLALGALAGQTLRYQFWYRDPLNPCGGGFNSTNGYAVGW